jgi:hypothetical protein
MTDMKTFEQGILYAPDEESGSMTEEAQLPQTIRVGDQEVPFDDLLKTYENRAKFERANHERAAEAKRALDQARAERQAIEEARRRQQEEHRAYLAALQNVTVAKKEDSAPPAPTMVDLLKDVDPVGDEGWHSKLANAIEQRDTQRETLLRQQMQQELERRTNALKTELERKLTTTTSTLEQREARKRAKDEADKHNSEVFNRRLTKEYADIASQLSDEDRQVIYEKVKSQISNDVGALGQDGQWRWNEEAVDNAMWMVPKARQLLVAREVASARGDGLSARLRGEAASRSTPTRSQRRGTGTPADNLAAKINTVAEQLAARRITREEALSQFTPDERRRIAPTFARLIRAESPGGT